MAHADSVGLCGVAGAISLLHDLNERAELVARDFLASLAQRGEKIEKARVSCLDEVLEICVNYGGGRS